MPEDKPDTLPMSSFADSQKPQKNRCGKLGFDSMKHEPEVVPCTSVLAEQVTRNIRQFISAVEREASPACDRSRVAAQLRSFASALMEWAQVAAHRADDWEQRW